MAIYDGVIQPAWPSEQPRFIGTGYILHPGKSGVSDIGLPTIPFQTGYFQTISATTSVNAPNTAIAWASWSAAGGVVTILDTYNISGIWKNATGDFTVGFQIPINKNFAWAGSCGNNDTITRAVMNEWWTPSRGTTFLRVSSYNLVNAVDIAYNSVTIFGRPV